MSPAVKHVGHRWGLRLEELEREASEVPERDDLPPGPVATYPDLPLEELIDEDALMGALWRISGHDWTEDDWPTLVSQAQVIVESIGLAADALEDENTSEADREEWMRVATYGLEIMSWIGQLNAIMGEYFDRYACADCALEGEFTPIDTPCSFHADQERVAAGLNPYYPVPKRHKGERYGLTQGELQAIYNRAGARCEICRRTDVRPARLHIDHNHDTGEVRGLLCTSCNTGIGLLKDNPEIVTAAAAYLTERGHYAS